MTTTGGAPKLRIVLAAERLIAEHGFDGVSLRQIGQAAGNANNSAVQYHFGSKEQLVEAVFAHRLPALQERRQQLIEEQRPDDLRGRVECYLLPILEQGAQEGSHYMSFLSSLTQSAGAPFLLVSRRYTDATEDFVAYVASWMPHVPEPLRRHRINQVIVFCVQAAAARERGQMSGMPLLPFAAHVADVLDGLVGFLQAPVSAASLAALEEAGMSQAHARTKT